MFYFLLFIIFILLLSLWGFYTVIRPFKITSTVTPKNFGVDYEPVQFKTEDNVLIKGWFVPSEKPHAKTIIVLHGYPADKGDILPSRIFLHKNYNLLFFDFRYLGESEGPYSTVGKNEVLDLRAAIQFLHQRGIDEVGVWGFSAGAAVVLLAAPELPEIKAIVAEAAYARLDLMAYDYYGIPGLKYIMGKLLQFWSWMFLGIDINAIQPAASIQKIKIPVLLIYSKTDQVIKFQHGILMQEAVGNHPNVKVIIVETRHGELIDNYQEIIQKFFDQALSSF